MKKSVMNTVSMVVWVSVLTVTIIMINSKWINPPKRIVTVDIMRIVQEKVVQMANKTVGEKSKTYRRTLVKQANRELEWALREIARQNNVLIVAKRAVVAGQTEDITDVVRSALGITRGNSTIRLKLSGR